MSKASSDQSLSLSAAGGKFQLGIVYDAYKHQLFEDLNLLKKCLDVSKNRSLCPSVSLDLMSSYTINERMKAFRFGGHVKVGVAFGFFKLGSASANYINDMSSSIGQARMTLQYKQTKRYEELDTTTVQKLSCNHEVLKSAKERGATHFVAGITYGNQVLIDFKFTKRHEKEHDLLDIQLRGVLRCGQFLANKLNKDEKQMTNVDDIQCKIFCESVDIKQPESFIEALDIYQNLPTTLQNVEVVDSVYLLPLSIIDKDAKKFKQSHINEVKMKTLVDIRDDLFEQEMQCAAMEKRGINAAKRLNAIKKYTEELKSTLFSTSVEKWNEEVVKHNSSKFQTQKFQRWMKKKNRARVCDRCRREFSTESELAEHMRIPEARSCRRCNKEFCSDLAFDQHIKNHEVRTCRKCNNELSTESELAQHMRIHEARTCNRCKKEFSTESELAEHMRNKQGNLCYICKKDFATESERLEHLLNHYARRCESCKKEFDTEEELVKHKSDIKARTCGRCLKEFSTESELAQHMREANAPSCSKCNKEFCTESELADHLRYYHARTCYRCNKEFSTEEELAQHRRDAVARTCGRCYNEFSTEEELAQHNAVCKKKTCLFRQSKDQERII